MWGCWGDGRGMAARLVLMLIETQGARRRRVPKDVLLRTPPGQTWHKPLLEGVSAAPLLSAAFLETVRACPTSLHSTPPSNSAHPLFISPQITLLHAFYTALLIPALLYYFILATCTQHK